MLAAEADAVIEDLCAATSGDEANRAADLIDAAIRDGDLVLASSFLGLVHVMANLVSHADEAKQGAIIDAVGLMLERSVRIFNLNNLGTMQ